MVVGNKKKRGRKKEKEGRDFRRLPSFFFPPLFVFSRIFSRGDFGVLRIRLAWDSEIFNCTFVWMLSGIRVGSDTGSGSGLNNVHRYMNAVVRDRMLLFLTRRLFHR